MRQRIFFKVPPDPKSNRDSCSCTTLVMPVNAKWNIKDFEPKAHRVMCVLITFMLIVFNET